MSHLAKAWAINAHGSQRYGDFPYKTHLEAVVQVLDRFCIADFAIIDAAWLHDVLEDTAITWDAICAEFGEQVADLVEAVTNEPGANRKERARLTYPKIRRHGHMAILVKLADRIANTEHSITHKTRHLAMYRREFPGFRAALYQPGECDAMWEHLERISA